MDKQSKYQEWLKKHKQYAPLPPFVFEVAITTQQAAVEFIPDFKVPKAKRKENK